MATYQDTVENTGIYSCKILVISQLYTKPLKLHYTSIFIHVHILFYLASYDRKFEQSLTVLFQITVLLDSQLIYIVFMLVSWWKNHINALMS